MRHPTDDEVGEMQALITVIKSLMNMGGVSVAIRTSVFYSLWLEGMINAAHQDGFFDQVMGHFRNEHARIGELLAAKDPEELRQIAMMQADVMIKDGKREAPH